MGNFFCTKTHFNPRINPADQMVIVYDNYITLYNETNNNINELVSLRKTKHTCLGSIKYNIMQRQIIRKYQILDKITQETYGHTLSGEDIQTIIVSYHYRKMQEHQRFLDERIHLEIYS